MHQNFVLQPSNPNATSAIPNVSMVSPKIIQFTHGFDVPTQQEARQCRQHGCSTMVKPPYARCPPCRTKNRAMEKSASTFFTTNKEGGKAETAQVEDSAVNGTQTGDVKKRKREVDGMSGTDAPLKKKKRREEDPIVETSTTQESQFFASTSKFDLGINEFQREEDMVKFLKKNMAKKPTTFRACYSIISNPTISYAQQAGIAARNIKKLGAMPFDYKKPIQSHSVASFCTFIYQCTCNAKKGSEAPGPTPAGYWSNGSKPMLSLTDIRAKLAGSGSGGLGGEQEQPCQGRIQVVVEEDKTHPLQIPGQKISLRIDH